MAFAFWVAVYSPQAYAKAKPHVGPYAIVNPITCLAGNWGTGHLEWRVQLAVFEESPPGVSYEVNYEKRLLRAGIVATHYTAAWLAGEKEPAVVVSIAFPSYAAAKLHETAIRKLGFPALTRQYMRYE